MLVYTDMRIPAQFRGVLLVLLFASLAGCVGGPYFTPEEKARFDAGWRRHDQARALLAAHDYERATPEYAELWVETTRPDAPVGTYFHGNMTKDISALVREHPPARAAFEAMREPVESRVLAGQATIGEEHHWIEFTQMIGAEDGLVAYAERFHKDRERMKRLAFGPWRAFDRLIEQGRWDLAGWVYANPVREAGVFKASYSGGPSPVADVLEVILSIPILPFVIFAKGMTSNAGPPGDEFIERQRQGFHKHMERMLFRGARIAAACTAAGRTKEARQILHQAMADVGEERAREVFDAAALAAGQTPQR